MITIIEDTPKKLSGITSLFISFNFKQQIVDTIKSLDKYHYNNENYTWEVPINNLSYLLDELTYFDDITLTIKSNDDNKEQKTIILKDKYKTKPLEHQLEGILYGLNHDSWLLLDDPGLGKTLQMIYLAQELKEQSNLKHCLVICGINSLKTNWESEIEKHSDLSYRILGKKVSKKGKVSYKTIKDRAKELLEPIDEFFIITNIETLRSDDIVKALKKNVNQIDMVVFDEAHKAKNPSSIQGNHLLKLTNYDHKVALTGTLIMNKPLDAFTALKWLGIEKATYTDFKNQYCEYGGFGGHQVIGYKNLDILKEEIENSSLRRTKDILKDLPEKTVITEMLDMEDDHKKFYSDIIDGVVAECDKVKLNPNNVLALTTRLRQAASCPSVLTSNKITATKIERALDLIEEIVCSGHKVVVMSTFKEPIRELYPLTKQYNALLGTGDQTDDELARNIKLFQTDDKYKVFLATTQKCGTGQTLNKASYMICIDCPWNYALQLQVEDRIHRIGSKEPVFIYRLVCKDTIDEKVNEYISVKKAVGDYLIDDIQDEATISKLRDYILDLKK